MTSLLISQTHTSKRFRCVICLLAIVLYRKLKGHLMTLMLSITADCFTNFLVTTKFSQLVAVYSDQKFRKYLENKQRAFLIPQRCYMHSRGK